VAECANAKLFEVLGGEAREDPLVDLVVAECRLVFFETRLRSQTTMSMMAPLLRSPRILIPSLRGCLAGTLCNRTLPAGWPARRSNDLLMLSLSCQGGARLSTRRSRPRTLMVLTNWSLTASLCDH
jgi:hypothetical protein